MPDHQRHVWCRPISAPKPHQSGRFAGSPVGRGNFSGVASRFTRTWKDADARNEPRDSRPSLPTFHVKPHQSGRFAGSPVGRGNFSGVASRFTRTWKDADARNEPRDSRPSLRRPSSLQRLTPCSPGGSETIRRPPSTRKRAAHSAVTAGLPNDRATTSSKDESRRASREATSLLPHMTSAKWGESGHSRTSRRKAVLFSMASRSVTRVRHRSNRTRPGTPPPLPRSSQVPGATVENRSQAWMKPSACSTWVEIGPGPKKPRALDSSRARGNQSDVT